MNDLHESRAEYWETLAMRLAMSLIFALFMAVLGWMTAIYLFLKGGG